LYASYSTGFLAPPLYRLFALEKEMTSGVTRGNKTLRAESSSSFEIGLKQSISQNLSITASYFRTITDDIIDYVYLWEPGKPAGSLTYLDYRGDTYLNIGQHFSSGIEIEIASNITNNISLIGNLSLIGGTLSYDSSKIDTTHIGGYQIQVFANGLFLGGKTKSLGLVRRPNTANVRITYDASEAFNLIFEASYAGRRDDFFYDSSLGPFGGLSTSALEGYGLINISARYALVTNLTAHFMIHNVLNARYSEIRGYNSVGRTFTVGLRHTI
jgi:vitamin B12 transporter